MLVYQLSKKASAFLEEINYNGKERIE